MPVFITEHTVLRTVQAYRPTGDSFTSDTTKDDQYRLIAQIYHSYRLQSARYRLVYGSAFHGTLRRKCNISRPVGRLCSYGWSYTWALAQAVLGLSPEVSRFILYTQVRISPSGNFWKLNVCGCMLTSLIPRQKNTNTTNNICETSGIQMGPKDPLGLQLAYTSMHCCYTIGRQDGCSNKIGRHSPSAYTQLGLWLQAYSAEHLSKRVVPSTRNAGITRTPKTNRA